MNIKYKHLNCIFNIKIRRVLLIVWFFLSYKSLLAQNDIWIYGYNANFIDFTQVPPDTGRFIDQLDIIFFGQQSSVYTEYGKLQFFASSRLFRKNFAPFDDYQPKVLIGGDSVDLDVGLNQWPAGVFIPSEDSNIINYIAVSEFRREYEIFGRSEFTNLQYFSIDKQINNGMGGSANGDLRADLFSKKTTEHLAITKGCEINQTWLVSRIWETGEFIAWDTRNPNPKDWPFVLSLTDGPPVYFEEGAFASNSKGTGEGLMKISKDGIIAFTTYVADEKSDARPLSLYQIDKSTGKIVYLFDIEYESPQSSAFGIEFSPDGSQLYVEVEFKSPTQSRVYDSMHIYQYDLSILRSAEVKSSEILLRSYAKIIHNFTTLQRSTRDEIFVSKPGSNHFDIIRKPNERGLNCNYEDSALVLSSWAGQVCLPILNPVPDRLQYNLSANSICAGNSLLLSAKFNGSIINAELKINNLSFNLSAPKDSVKFDFDSAGIYPLKLIYTNGCSFDTLFDTITVAEPFQFELPNDTILCAGDTHQLLPILSDTANQHLLTYLWQDGSVEPFYTTWDTTKLVTLTLSNGCGFSTDSVLVEVDIPLERTLPEDTTGCGEILTLSVPTWEGASILWSTGSTDTSTLVVQEGLVTVLGTNTCGVLGDTANVQFKEVPSYPANSDTVWCSLEALAIKIPVAEGETILWNNEATSASYTVERGGEQTVAVTNFCGTWHDTFQVQKIDPPIVNLGKDTTLCMGETIVLGVPNDTLSVLWSDGSRGDSIIVDSAGVYAVQISNTCYTVSDTISIDYFLPPITTLADTVTACLGNEGVFEIDNTNQPVWQYQNEQEAGNRATFRGVSSDYVTVDYQDTLGCPYSDSVFFEVFSLPIALGGQDDTICTGDSVQLSAVGGLQYRWSPPEGLSNDTIAQPWASPAITTIYTVEVTDQNGCEATDSIAVVNGNETGVTLVSTDFAVCRNLEDTVEIVYNNEITYDWVYADSAAFVNDSLIAVFPKEDAFFILRGRNALGCKSRDSIFIEALPLPEIVFPLSDSACYGEQLVFAYPASQSPTISPLSNVQITSDTITFDVLASMDYRWSWTNTLGCTIADSIGITVLHPDSVTLPNQLTTCQGDSLHVGYEEPVFLSQWIFISDMFNQVDSISFLPSQTDTLHLATTSEEGCEADFSVAILVNELPIVELIDSINACAGDTVGLICENCAAGTLFWSTEPNTLIENNGQSQLIARQSGWVVLQLTDNNGCSNKDSFYLDVTIPKGLEAFRDTNICRGDTLQYMLTLENPISVDGINFNLSDTQLQLFPGASAAYFITANDTVCAAAIQLQIDIDTLDYSLQDTLIICGGDTAQLILSAAQVTYAWMPKELVDSNTIQQPRAFPNQSETFSVTMTNNSGCTFIDSTFINVLPNNGLSVNETNISICAGDTAVIGYSLEDGLTLTVTTSVDFEIEGDKILVYADTTTTVVLNTENTNGCSQRISVLIVVNELPKFTIDGPTALCTNEQATITLTEDLRYTISPLPSDSLTESQYVVEPGIEYTITGATPAGCSSSLQYTIEPLPIPAIQVTQLDAIICTDEQALFQVQGAANWSWTPSVATDILDSDTLFLSALVTTEYTVIGIGDNGCRDSVSAEVTVVDYGEPALTILPPEGICVGDSLFLSASGGTSYAWSGLQPNDCADCTSGFAQPQASGEVTLTLFREECSTLELTSTYTVNTPPVLTVDSVILADLGSDVPLVAQSNGVPTWRSDVHELQCAQCLETVLLNVVDNDFVYVTVEDAIGCRTSDTIQIIVANECATALLPNAFTANKDGLNDRLEVLYTPGSKPQLESMRVWNRWGELVFETNDELNLWTAEGHPIGMYQVEVVFNCFGVTKVLNQGVQVIR